MLLSYRGRICPESIHINPSFVPFQRGLIKKSEPQKIKSHKEYIEKAIFTESQYISAPQKNVVITVVIQQNSDVATYAKVHGAGAWVPR